MFSRGLSEAQSWKNSLSEADTELVHAVLERLPEDSRIVIYLHYWRDLELKEIAEILCLRMRDVEYIHKMTLQLLTKVFGPNKFKTKEAVA